mmetsp:Transcript_27309/g.49447  ORF Transcript_27309/g.49447 Transcript_27309/m.49447 type:complete len:97 (-) Transcript_27309:777-1067(-)
MASCSQELMKQSLQSHLESSCWAVSLATTFPLARPEQVSQGVVMSNLSELTEAVGESCGEEHHERGEEQVSSTVASEHVGETSRCKLATCDSEFSS